MSELPRGWSEVSIAELGADVSHAMAIGPFGSDLKTSDYTRSGVPVVFVRNVRENRYDPTDCRFVSPDKARSLRAHRVTSGDLVITKMGLPPGIAAEYPDGEPDGVVTADIIKMTPDKKRVHPGYLCRLINSVVGRTQVAQFTSGQTRPKVTLRDFRELRVPLPPLPEQKRIAAILDKADAIRRKRQEAIRLTEELLRSAFLEMFGDPVTNPKGWEVKKLGELGGVTTGATPRSSESGMFGGDIPFMTPGDLESGGAPKRYLTPRGAHSVRTVRAGSALVCCIGATIGKMGIAPVKCAFNQQINAVEWNEQVLDEFGLAALRFFKATIAGAAKSTTMPILKKSSFAQVVIPVPPVLEQAKYDRLARRVATALEREESALVSCTKLSASLTQRAFSGGL